MAQFYGSVQGARGEATRLGGRQSGMRTIAASWEGSVRVYVYDNGGVDWAAISLQPWHGRGCSILLYNGPVAGEGFVNLPPTLRETVFPKAMQVLP